jgi:hypothetical protein
VTVCYLEPREQSARARRRRIAAQFDFECICKLCTAATAITSTDSASYYAPLEATIDGITAVSVTAAGASDSTSTSSSRSVDAKGNSDSSGAAAAAAADDTLAEELDALESAIAAACGSSDRPVAWGSVLARALT